MPSKKPTWALLPPSGLLPGNKAPLYLGRLVAAVDYPSLDYVPDDPREALYPKSNSNPPSDAAKDDAAKDPKVSQKLPSILTVVDTDAELFLSLHHATKVHTQLTKILGLGHEKEESENKSVKSSRVITRLLPQYRKAFQALMAQHEETVLELLNENGGKGYFIVGVKTCIDAQLSDQSSSRGKDDANFQFPVQQLIALLGGVPFIAGDSLNVGGTLDDETKSQLLTRFVATGERIFSLQFREVRIRGWSHEEPKVKGFYHPPANKGTFAGEEEPIESLDDGPDLADDGDDIDIEVGWGLEIAYEDMRPVAKELTVA